MTKKDNGATHIGGDLFAKYDDTKYVDIMNRQGVTLCFMSVETLIAAHSLFPPPDIFDLPKHIEITPERKLELRECHNAVFDELLAALDDAEKERERLRLELRKEQRRQRVAEDGTPQNHSMPLTLPKCTCESMGTPQGCPVHWGP